MNKETIKSIAKIIVITLIICAIGFFAINQLLEFKYRTYFLAKPCQLCGQLNPTMKECLSRNFSTYYSANGSWKDIYGHCFDMTGKEIQCNDININLTLPVSNK